MKRRMMRVRHDRVYRVFAALRERGEKREGAAQVSVEEVTDLL